LRMVPQGEGAANIENFQLLLDGIPQPNLARRVPGSAGTLVLTMPGIGQKAEVKGSVRGAAQGTLLFRRF